MYIDWLLKPMYILYFEKFKQFTLNNKKPNNLILFFSWWVAKTKTTSTLFANFQHLRRKTVQLIYDQAGFKLVLRKCPRGDRGGQRRLSSSSSTPLLWIVRQTTARALAEPLLWTPNIFLACCRLPASGRNETYNCVPDPGEDRT